MLFLAMRQMLAKKLQTFLILLGICFGTMVYVLIAGVQFGMREYLAEQLLNNTAHVIISGNDRSIDAKDLRERFFPGSDFVKWLKPPAGKRDEAKLENPQGWFDRLNSDSQVRNYSARLTVTAIAVSGNLKRDIAISGIIPERHLKVTSLGDYIKQGKFSDLKAGTNNLVIGSGVADKLGAQLGQNIKLITGSGEPRIFRLAGIIHLGNDQVDNTIALAHLSDVQSLNRTPGRVSEILVSLFEMDRSKPKAAEWSLTSNDKVQSWEQANAAFMQIIQIQDAVRIVITAAILLVSAFGIYNILSIMISQKQKEIAILRSIGYGPNRILSLILMQGLALGFFGSILGIALGYVILLWVGQIDLGIQIGKGSSLIISYKSSIFITAFVAAQISALVASLLPARQAALMTPLDIIRANL